MPLQARVLLIDDDAAALWMARAFLEDAGFEAHGVSTVSELETMVADWAPDVVVADVDMPSLSGPDLCRMLKDRFVVVGLGWSSGVV